MEYPFTPDFRITPHFRLEEFSCRHKYKPCPFCGGSVRLRDLPVIWDTAYKLETLRENLSLQMGAEVEIILSDATRCLGRTAFISTCDPPWNSPHFRGFAIDIIARFVKSKISIEPNSIAALCRVVFSGRLILLEEDHVHIDLT